MAETYLNPVYGREFPDPFVLKFCGEYWAYCTGFWSDGRCFGILHSTDLVHWQELGGALEPLPANHPYYWAPEVSYYNGHFYLYYSTGNETLMEIRVAVAEHPAGPFVDSGRRLTHEDFAIDAHVFQDEDESRYLFYATDYPEHTHIGTGTAVDRMLDPFTLAGKPRPVTRARYDWQVYDPHRIEKGGVRWHTIEGPFVLKHKGIYYQMFSGGNWKNISYGVSYATSHSLSNPDEWQQVADGQQVLPILRTIPDKVIGPGHNSVVRGPDNRQLYCVYHRWALDGSARLLAIDPLDWAGERMLILGPSTGPEPVPNPPTLSGFEASGWIYSGEHWSAKDGVLRQENATASAAAILKFDQPYYVAEFSLRTLSPQPSAGTFGFTLHNNDTALLRFELNPARQQARVILPATDKVCEWNLPPDFNFGAYHLLWLELYANEVKLALDEGKQLPFHLPQSPTGLALFTENCPATFAGFSLTLGWEDRFDAGVAPGGWEVAEQQLWGRANGQPRFITKGPLLEAYELVVNARLVSQISPEGGYGFYPAYLSQEQPGPLIRLKQVQNDHNGWILHYEDSGKQQILPLPPKFDPSSYQQFRFRKTGDRLSLRWENH
jgi:GH43 family beta-xylosidase